MPISSGRLNRTLVAVFLVTLLTLIVLSKSEGNSIHVLSGLLLSWFIPGFALMIVLYPNEPILSIRSVILSIITSFVLDILVGTLLDILNLGLNELGFVIGLWLITVLLLIIGTSTFYTSSRISSSQTEIDSIRQSTFKLSLVSVFEFARSNYVVILLLVSVLFITVSWAFRVNLRAANDVKPKTFTALAIDPLNDVTNKHLRITIDNREGKSMVYRLEMRRNSVLFMEWENIILSQGEQWAVEIPLSQLVSQNDLRLFRNGESEPYRQVHLVVP